MKIFFVTRNRNLNQVFADLVLSEDDSMDFYDEPLELMSDLASRQKNCDLVVFDGTYFLRYKDFIYHFMVGSELKVPTIFINDNTPKEGREISWLFQNEMFYEQPRLHFLLSIFETISNIIELPFFKNAMEEKKEDAPSQPASPSSLEDAPSQPVKLQPLEDAPSQPENLSPVLLQLFNQFYKNRLRTLSLEEIASSLNLSPHDQNMRNNAAYAYVSRLRKSIDTSSSPLKLIRVQKGQYRLIEKNSV